MRATFTAQELGVHRDENAIVCGIRGRDSYGRERYVVLQRQTYDGPDDEGVHFELDDEVSSGYEIVSSCTLTGTTLEITLFAPAGNRTISEVAIELGRASGSREDLTAGLRQVFRAGTIGMLHLS